MEPKENSSSFYSIFENTFDYLKNSISFSSQPNPEPEPKTVLKTPLEHEKIIFETKLNVLKKLFAELSGTKLSYMVERYESEGVYMYI